ncbi:PHP domain-containing protein [Treponema sp. TIM-1]|uniref:PHP domain-containing protein n=1 Tax=Treponema sp. TIM-1 TaxID=2898417 RepID=UPI0039800DF2
MSFLYETHLHTCQSSACGVSEGHEYIRNYLALGYTGIMVTDHFFNGNTRINRSLPWKEWVTRFCRGYEDTRRAGERLGLDVFFGWEETFDGDDYLIYGLDKEWLLEHPEAAHWTRREQYETVNLYGGCVVQAHPFRQHYYIDCIHLSTGCVDAVEAANGGNQDPSYDALALAYAQRLGLPITAGSDIHHIDQCQTDAMYGVYLDKKMTSINDYVRAIKTHTLAGIRTTPGRCDLRGDEIIRLPVDIRDARDRSTRQDIGELLGYREPVKK